MTIVRTISDASTPVGQRRVYRHALATRITHWISALCVTVLLMSGLQRQERLPDSDAAARLLGISPASLRRRLQDSGASYAKIRAGCQREWAEYLLAFTRSPVQEIAVQLGFGDDRAFRRAFRKWTGHGPAEFRRGRGVQAETSA